MMTKKNVLVYDDDGTFTAKIRESLSGVEVIRKRFNVASLSEDAFVKAMKQMADRNRVMRKGEPWTSDDCPFDKVDIAIVDQDLLNSSASQFVTGEEVAYLLRCFSKCGLIVILNQFGQNSFDLTLRGNPDSFADLNVGSDQIHNPNLWGGEKDGFFPWHWPVLPRYLDDFERRVKDVEASLESQSTIRDTLEIPEDVFAILPRNTVQFLGADPENITFDEFVKKSGKALKPKDAKKVPDEVTARVGAARIAKWLERVVVPDQGVLVDAPHLVSRYPSLLKGKANEKATWNRTAVRDVKEVEGCLRDVLAEHRFSKDYWLSRPVWFWPNLSADSAIPEVKEPWNAAQARYCFCEDASQFYPQSSCSRFIAEVDSPFVQRFVKKFAGVDYRPVVRFAM